MKKPNFAHLDLNQKPTKSLLNVKVVNKSRHALPEYATEHAAGMDIRANLDKAKTLLVIHPKQTKVIKTGLFLEIPVNFEAQIRPRSGWAAKHSITVMNSPGTIDADYRGEVGVILHNGGTESFSIEDGDRIAQMVFTPVVQAKWQEVDSVEDLSSTDRGEGGFGSTGGK